MQNSACACIIFPVSKTNLPVHEDKNRVPYVKVSTWHCWRENSAFSFVRVLESLIMEVCAISIGLKTNV